MRKQRLLILIVAYNAESTLGQVLARIPDELEEKYDVEVVVIDDASRDKTFEVGEECRLKGDIKFPLHVLFNPENQGYGGNQKIGYHYAIKNNFDFVALVHGDGQYAPECLPGMLEPLSAGEADAVFGSRMMQRGAALKGGMPFYKFVGNKILSWFENRMLRTNFSEFHSGFRIYATAALKKVPFDLNTNDFHFDTEIITQFVIAGLRIREVPIPTYYGDEICHVQGLKYAYHVVKAVLKARAQELSLFFDRRYDCAGTNTGNEHYELKIDYDSPHSAALAEVKPSTKVLDLGCASGYMGTLLKQERGCEVTGVDMFPLGPGVKLDKFVVHDLTQGPPDLRGEHYDYILMLDVIEHIPVPEVFIDRLREQLKFAPDTTLIVSTGNIAFIVTRLMLLFGQFNYGKRGILDITHTRLFTFASMRRLFEQGGFRVIETRGIAAPFPLVFGSQSRLGKLLVGLNRALVKAMRSMFSYQIFMVVQPRPSLEYLLERAEHHSAPRAQAHRQRRSAA